MPLFAPKFVEVDAMSAFRPMMNPPDTLSSIINQTYSFVAEQLNEKVSTSAKLFPQSMRMRRSEATLFVAAKVMLIPVMSTSDELVVVKSDVTTGPESV